jgi:hypothetical protein
MEMQRLFEAQRRLALEKAADGLSQALQQTQEALLAFGLECIEHTQGHSDTDTGYADAWLVSSSEKARLVPLRLELDVKRLAPSVAHVELNVWLLASDPDDKLPVADVTFYYSTARAHDAQSLDSELLYSHVLRLLETIAADADNLAAGISDALAH